MKRPLTAGLRLCGLLAGRTTPAEPVDTVRHVAPRPPSRVADPQARAQAVLSGEVDLAGDVPPTAADRGASAGMTVVRKPGATTYPLVTRTDTPPFSGPRVREAMQLPDAVFLRKGALGNDILTSTDPSSPRHLPQIEREARLMLTGSTPGF